MEPEPRTCAFCGVPLVGMRSDARYCSGTCRKRAFDAGLSRTTEVARKVQPTHVPARQRKPSIDDVALMFSDAIALESSFRFASSKADFRLRPLCTRMADALRTAIDREGVR